MATGQFDTLRFEQVIGRRLEDEERDRITLWEKGKALQQMVSMPGWQVLLEMLQSYPVNALKELAAIDPRERDEVLAQQSVAYAGNRIYLNFQEDVANAVLAAKKPPDFISAAIKDNSLLPRMK